MNRQDDKNARNPTSRGESTILVLNSGSSSIKFACYCFSGRGESLVLKGAAEEIATPEAHFWVRGTQNDTIIDQAEPIPDHTQGYRRIFDALERDLSAAPEAVGHRVVHGGANLTAPALVDERVLDRLRELVPFAPLHLPGTILGIESVATRFPCLPQVACFDTAFHRRMPEVAQRFPLPGELWDQGVRRYGFHGLSYEYILETLGARARGRVVIAHLGNGASMAAVHHGHPIDTTMGFTPAGGFMMGTRSGDLDPGILVYLLNEKRFSADQVDQLVNRRSGLLGVSGTSPDMKCLLDQRASDPAADLAICMFCYQIRKHIGALAAALGGLDLLVFTGGIGERGAAVRWEICEGLNHLGITLDPKRNDAHAPVISAPRKRCTVRVVPTNEELMIARHTRRLLSG